MVHVESGAIVPVSCNVPNSNFGSFSFIRIRRWKSIISMTRRSAKFTSAVIDFDDACNAAVDGGVVFVDIGS